MPKITVHGGPSNRFEPQPPQPRPGEGVFFQPKPEPAADDAQEVPQTGGPVELIGEGPEPPIDIDDEGGASSPGSSSSPSSLPSGRKTGQPGNKGRSRARTTEPPSNPPPTAADGTAPTATTSGPETGGEASPNLDAD